MEGEERVERVYINQLFRFIALYSNDFFFSLLYQSLLFFENLGEGNTLLLTGFRAYNHGSELVKFCVQDGHHRFYCDLSLHVTKVALDVSFNQLAG